MRTQMIRSSINTSRLNYLVTAILFLCIAYFSLGHSDDKGYFIITHYANAEIPLNWTAAQTADWAGGADVGTYIKAAKFYLENGHFQNWVINLFPPGQMYYHAALIKLTGEEYFPLKIVLTSVLAWLTVFLLATRILNNLGSHIMIPIIVLLPMYFTAIREYIFGYGVLGAEMLSMPLFVALIYLVLEFNKRYGDRKYQALVALILALLAYFRGYFEIFGNIAIAVFFLFLAFNYIFAMFRQYVRGEMALSLKAVIAETKIRRDQVFGPKVRSLLVILVIFSLLLLPWRVSNVERGFTMSWLHAVYYWGLVWQTDEDTHPSFSQTGINTPCRTEPELCQALSNYKKENDGQKLSYNLYARLAIMTFLTRPVTWYKNKLQYLDNLWYGNDWKSEAKNKTWRFLQGVVIVLSAAFYYIYYLVKWKKADQGYRDLYIASLVFVVFNVMLFTMLHFEMRYSIFLKLLFITMAVLILQEFIRAYLARRQE